MIRNTIIIFRELTGEGEISTYVEKIIKYYREKYKLTQEQLEKDIITEHILVQSNETNQHLLAKSFLYYPNALESIWRK